MQIGRVCRTISQAEPVIRTCTLTGMGMSQATYARELEKLERGVEILVATPGKAVDLIQREVLQLGHLQVCVNASKYVVMI